MAFAAAWVGAGARTPDYSPVRDTISQLAATDAPYRGWMTAGFLVFGIGVTAFAAGHLRRSAPGPAWMVTAVAGLSTIGVAFVPLGPGRTAAAHWALAGAGYAGVTLAPLVAVPRTRWAVAAGVVSVTCLLASTAAGDASGLFQRAGLTVAHAWIVTTALRAGRA